MMFMDIHHQEVLLTITSTVWWFSLSLVTSQVLTVSLYLILSSLPLTSKHRKSWWKTRQRTFINSLGVITKAMRSGSIAALHTRNSPGMSSVLLKANGNDDGIR